MKTIHLSLKLDRGAGVNEHGYMHLSLLICKDGRIHYFHIAFVLQLAVPDQVFNYVAL